MSDLLARRNRLRVLHLHRNRGYWLRSVAVRVRGLHARHARDVTERHGLCALKERCHLLRVTKITRSKLDLIPWTHRLLALSLRSLLPLRLLLRSL